MTSTPHPIPVRPMPPTPRFDPPSPREAFRMARGLEHARVPQQVAGHRLYWMTSGSFGSFDLEAGASTSALVLGSHPLCDVRLLDEVGVELRHLLIRSTMVDDGCPLLSVLDLNSPHGFYLSNGSAERSIDATGAVVFRVGGYALVAIPSGRSIPDELPRSIVESSIESPYRSAAFSPELLARPVDGSSRITLLPCIVDAEQASRTMTKDQSETYEITLSSPTASRSIRVAGSDLRRGVLVGRSLNCDPALRLIVDMGISRGHLLFLKDRHGETAYDLSSTQGTFSFGRRERVIELSDRGTTMMIGHAQKLRLTWRRIL